MRIGSILEDWIGQRLKIKPYLRWECIWPYLELNKEGYLPHYRWHGQANIKLGCSTHRTQQIDVSCAAMPLFGLPKPALRDSPQSDNFQLKFR